MRKIIPLVVSGCLCLCMFGCGGSSSPATAPEETTQSQEQGASDSETNENKSETEAISETSKTTGKAEDIVGDWSGQAEVHLEYNEGPFEAVLSAAGERNCHGCSQSNRQHPNLVFLSHRYILHHIIIISR